MNRMNALLATRRAARQEQADESVARILEDARRHGLDLLVVGSLGKGDFRLHSDVDLLVRGAITPARRALAERLVAQHLRHTGLPYDLLFEADLSPDRLADLLHDLV
ncbi:nucleotidyltransferase domain-containing protein [Allorhizobium pseudoryzae]|uniref:nucleotidyltransferase domain-containing protein n=1 Tax=Allorhizobium pseudoryzae TaxID=379684 RepID=UPI003D07A595